MLWHPRPSRSHPRRVNLIPDGRVLVSSRRRRRARLLLRPPRKTRRSARQIRPGLPSLRVAAPATTTSRHQVRWRRVTARMPATNAYSNDLRSLERSVPQVPEPAAGRPELESSLPQDVGDVRRHQHAPTELAGVRESPVHVKKSASVAEPSRETCGRYDGVWTN